MAMEGGESPLDVLSRAATMLQEQSPILNDENKQTSTKQLPTTKWKRDRRTRPEYTRKSDPKVPEVFEQSSVDGGSEGSSHHQENGDEERQCNGNSGGGDTPLDMSVRQRGLPPSYNQAISDPSFRSNYKSAPVVPANQAATTAPAPVPAPAVVNVRDELPTGISMCDPIIDEHFRRSLGKDYMTVFSNNNVSKEVSPSPSPSPPKTRTLTPPSPTSPPPLVTSSSSPVTPPLQQTSSPPPPVTVTTPPTVTRNVIELMDNTGLSVDDHFAKALGDTWLKLNKKDTELKTNTADNQSMVTI